jgi:DNA excision repair protein ERCC-2
MIEYTVSVTELATFCERQGDIDHRFTPSPTGAEGTEGHQRIYRRRPESYCPEFSVSQKYTLAGIVLHLRGRADGFDASQGMVEEIKTCRVEPSTIPESVTRLHLAQARLYAALICCQEQLPEVLVRLTWLQLDSDVEHPLEQLYSSQELEAFLQRCVGTYCEWLLQLAQLREVRDKSLHALNFPYTDFRPRQRDISELVYKCIDQSGQLMLEAPTGIGKTAAVLYPALKALATGKHDRVIFSTAKVIGRRTAEQTLQIFESAGLQINSLSLTAKDSVCFSPGKACHADDCPYALAYYDKLPAAREAAVHRGQLTREKIEVVAREHKLCPYQLAIDLIPWVDLIIADLHYLYSLTATLAAQLAGDGLRWTVLVDEAHNLPVRARDMFRASLAKADLMAARRNSVPGLASALDRVNRVLLSLQRQDWRQPDYHSEDVIDEKLLQALQNFVSSAGERMAADATVLQRNPELMEFYFSVLQFLRVADKWGPEFRFELSRGLGKQGLKVALNCLDPARLLAERQTQLHASINFSATLSPPDWLRSGLGLGESAVCRQLGSPFLPEQLQVTIDESIDTRYRQRERSLALLAKRIDSWLGEHAGNCIVYFPSYRYLQSCLSLLEADASNLSQRTLWVQRSRSETQTSEPLPDLLAQQKNVAAFCILGGVYGEGIDLPGELLSSVVIVGVGLPQFGQETEQLRDYFQQEYGRGFEFAYLYPGLQKVNQALGRVVRDGEDRGHALLIDSRYRQMDYRQLLAPWWQYIERPVER